MPLTTSLTNNSKRKEEANKLSIFGDTEPLISKEKHIDRESLNRSNNKSSPADLPNSKNKATEFSHLLTRNNKNLIQLQSEETYQASNSKLDRKNNQISDPNHLSESLNHNLVQEKELKNTPTIKPDTESFTFQREKQVNFNNKVSITNIKNNGGELKNKSTKRPKIMNNNHLDEYVEKGESYLLGSARPNGIQQNTDHDFKKNSNSDSNNNDSYNNNSTQYLNGNSSHPIQNNSNYNLHPNDRTSSPTYQRKSSQYTPTNKVSNGLNNNNAPQQLTRRPINASTEENIYTVQSNSSFNNNNKNSSVQRQLTHQSTSSSSNKQPIRQQRPPAYVPSQRSDAAAGGRTERGKIKDPYDLFEKPISPTRTVDNGPKILKRELWWKEPPPSQVTLPQGSKPKVENIGSKIDHKNLSYNPSRQNSKIIENRKLDWNKQAAVDTWGNFSHQPKGGNRKYPQEAVSWSALPKIDSGFIYTFDHHHNQQQQNNKA